MLLCPPPRSETLLVNESTSLARGSNEVFTIKEDDVGTVQKLSVRVAKTANASTWNLSRIEVTHVAKGVTSTFLHNAWVSVDAGTVEIRRDVPIIDYKVGEGGG